MVLKTQSPIPLGVFPPKMQAEYRPIIELTRNDIIWAIRKDLGSSKTEFLVIGTRQQLNKLSPSVLHVGDHTIDSSVNVKEFGIDI